jgi:hypothetical protein
VGDMVNHPDHYKARAIECLTATRGMGFSLGNSVKYVYRAPFKGNIVQDLEKARFYMRDHIKHSEGAFCFLGCVTREALRRLAVDSGRHERRFFQAVAEGRWGAALSEIEGLIADAAEQD